MISKSKNARWKYGHGLSAIVSDARKVFLRNEWNVSRERTIRTFDQTFAKSLAEKV